MTMLSQEKVGHNRGPHQQTYDRRSELLMAYPLNNCLDAVFELGFNKPFDILGNLLNLIFLLNQTIINEQDILNKHNY